MPVVKTYKCDWCGGTPEYDYLSVETTTIKTKVFVEAMYWSYAPDPIFCSWGCLAKYVEPHAKKYDRENNENI